MINNVCVSLELQAANEIKIKIFFISFRTRKTVEHVIAGNKSTNKFADLAITGHGPELTRGKPVGRRWCKLLY
jgi:NaMN:DMB phosphoribosyltransferase